MKTFKSILVLAADPSLQIKVDRVLKLAGINNNIYMAADSREAIALLQDSLDFSERTKFRDPHFLILIDRNSGKGTYRKIDKYIREKPGLDRNLFVLSTIQDALQLAEPLIRPRGESSPPNLPKMQQMFINYLREGEKPVSPL